jgi:VanZ like family/Concanavalin A-like lectin/glucanases superfamily
MLPQLPGAAIVRRANGQIQTMLLRAICAFVLLGILVAGLWPFHAPRNEVRWLGYGNGLFFGKYGSIVSAVPFKLEGLDADRPCSLELWVQPNRADASGTILAFYWPENQIVPFAVRQSLDDLLVQLASQKQLQDAKKTRIYAAHVFSHQRPVLLTISSGQSGTTVYADGTAVRRAPNFRFSSHELTGQFIVGNSPTTTHTWSGQLRELAIYDRELSADEVSKHYSSLAQGGQAVLAEKGAVAIYLFNEGTGSVVHNQVDAATDLIIPERFFVLHEPFLEPFRGEFYPGWHYWKDIAINIGGFIPLGFFFCAYLSWMRRSKRAVASTIVLGFFVSLTIEVLQAFLPTRNSGMTDLITNTFGSALGAISCVWIMKQNWFGVPVRPSIGGRRDHLQLAS